MFNKDPELEFRKIDPHSPHSIVLDLVGSRRSVLDVGCNTGYIGEYLIKNKGCICDGIDYDAQFLQRAKERGYRNTYQLDLYKTDFDLEFKYDVILFIDILEHLPDPHRVLQKIVSKNLAPSGEVIICLPNIARLEYRVKHLLGEFEYEKSGIMHQDHLRFFTKKSAVKMIRQTPLKITRVISTGLGHRWKIVPNLTAFQFMFICRK